MNSFHKLRPQRIFGVVLAVLLALSVAIGQPPTPDDHFREGVEHLRAKDFERALASFRESDRLSPRKASTTFNIGSALVGLRRFAEAEESFKKGLELAPGDVNALAYLCNVLAINGKSTEAITTCRKAAEFEPVSAGTAAALINGMFVARFDTDEAGTYVAKALLRFPDDRWVLESAVMQAINSGNGTYATELLNRLIALDPRKAFYVGFLATVYLELAREDDAIASARKALEIEPRNRYGNIVMGGILAELGLHDEAISALSKVLESDPNADGARFKRAVSLDSAGKRTEAIADLRVVVAAKPNVARYNYFLGKLLADDGQFREAVVFLKKAVELDPKDFQSVAALGIALGSVPDYEQSIRVLETADRMRPGNNVIAMVMNAQRARQQAVPRIAEAIEESRAMPNDVNRKIFVIRLLAYSGRMKEAEPYIQEVEKLSPNDVRASQAIAVAYLEAGEPDKAAEFYKRQLLIKEDPGTYLGLANIYQKRGKNEEAAQAFAKVIELKSDTPSVMKIFADHLRNMGKRREALEMYKRSLSLAPNNAPALFQAGLLSLRFNDVDSAKQYLEMLKLTDVDLAKRLEKSIKYKLVLV
jgi:tetratricopeptide (TPR) repeat protein